MLNDIFDLIICDSIEIHKVHKQKKLGNIDVWDKILFSNLGEIANFYPSRNLVWL